MSISSWIKHNFSDGPPQKNETLMIAESLLHELDYHMREKEEEMRQKDLEEKRQKAGVDYTWLVSATRKPFEMGQLERLELEELCMQVKPEESGRIITEFRNAVQRDATLEEMPRLLRAVIIQVLEGRPKEDTMTEWMMKSVSKLRPVVNKVAPYDGGDNHASASASSSASRSSNEIEMQPQDMESGMLFTRVDNLPV